MRSHNYQLLQEVLEGLDQPHLQRVRDVLVGDVQPYLDWAPLQKVCVDFGHVALGLIEMNT